MAAQMIECYNFKSHFAEPQTKMPLILSNRPYQNILNSLLNDLFANDSQTRLVILE